VTHDQPRSPSPDDAGDERMAGVISFALRAGVLLSAALVLLGAILYLARHGGSLPLYHTFPAESRPFRGLGGVLSSALAGRGRSIILLGLLVLIATPAIRVLLSFVGFVALRDRVYVLVSGIVLIILAASLLSLP